MITEKRWTDYLLEALDHRPWIVPALIGLVYLVGFTGTWRPEPDAALYLNLGRNLAEGHGYTYHQVPHRLAYPGWPWVLSVLFWLTPQHAVFLGHVVLLLIGLAGLALMYRLMSLHTTRAMALMLTAGLAALRTYYQYCFEMRSDIMFMFGVMMTLAGYEGIVRRGEIRNGDARPAAAQPNPRIDWPLFIGGLIVGTVTRPTMYPILAALVLAILWDVFRKRLSKGFLVVLVLPVVAGVGFMLFSPRSAVNPSGLADYEDFVLNAISLKRLGANFVSLLQPVAAEAMFGLELPRGLNILGSLLALAAGLAMFRQRALWGLIVVFTIAMMAVSIVQDRYFLPILPMMVYGWWQGLRWINHRLPRRWGNLAFAVLFVFGSFPNGAKVGDIFIEQRHPNPLTAFRRGRFASVDSVTAMLLKHVQPGEYVYAPRKTDRIFTFKTGRNVLEHGQTHRANPDKVTVFVLLNAEFDGRVPFANRLGDEIGRLQGKYDKKPWVLYRVK